MNDNDRRVCFSPAGFDRFLSALQTRLGSAGDSILFSMARDFGMHDTRQMLETLEQDSVPGDELSIVTKILDSIGTFGWGDYGVEKFDLIGGEVIVSISDNPTFDLTETGESPQCFFMKGIISGVLKIVTEIEFLPSAHTCDEENNVHNLTFTRQ